MVYRSLRVVVLINCNLLSTKMCFKVFVAFAVCLLLEDAIVASSVQEIKVCASCKPETFGTCPDGAEKKVCAGNIVCCGNGFPEQDGCKCYEAETCPPNTVIKEGEQCKMCCCGCECSVDGQCGGDFPEERNGNCAAGGIKYGVCCDGRDSCDCVQLDGGKCPAGQSPKGQCKQCCKCKVRFNSY